MAKASPVQRNSLPTSRLYLRDRAGIVHLRFHFIAHADHRRHLGLLRGVQRHLVAVRLPDNIGVALDGQHLAHDPARAFGGGATLAGVDTLADAVHSSPAVAAPKLGTLVIHPSARRRSL